MKTPVVWGIVPARGGSKGVPRKNVKLLAGRPLLHYTAKPALESGIFSRLVLSTEDPEIAKRGKDLGLDVPFARPAELALDTTPMIDVLLYTVERLLAENTGPRPDLIFLLQPTSPFRTPELIRRLVDRLWSTGADSLITVMALPQHCSPDFVMKIVDGKITFFLEAGGRVTRRQDARIAYLRNGTAYILRLEALLRNRSIYCDNAIPFIQPAEESLTIDDLEDWEAAERHFARTGKT